ncbi:MAG: SGNH/GDSL hydrolase family protein [Candidatus Binatia bacterium]
MLAACARTLVPSAVLALALAMRLPVDAAEVGPPRPIRIMPLGDSITEGRSGDATWRYWLQKSLEAEGCVVDYVGSRRGVLHGAPRFSDFDPDHEGHWGWTTAEVLAEIDRWAADARPAIVLLHLGTNDLRGEPERIAANLAAIVASLRRASPAVEIYLARLIPLAGAPEEVMKRANDAISRLAAERDRPDSRLIAVDQYTGFDPRTDSYDGVHPNESGERKMAGRWLEALRARLDCLRRASLHEKTQPEDDGSARSVTFRPRSSAAVSSRLIACKRRRASSS